MEFTARSGADVIDFTAVGSAYTIFADTGTGDGSADAKIVLEEYTGHANVGPLTAADFILQDCRVIAFRTDAAHAGHTWQ